MDSITYFDAFNPKKNTTLGILATIGILLAVLVITFNNRHEKKYWLGIAVAIFLIGAFVFIPQKQKNVVIV